jgi:hypothetical protein
MFLCRSLGVPTRTSTTNQIRLNRFSNKVRYQALAEAGLHSDWVAGISIGAINSALMLASRHKTSEGIWKIA